MLSVKGFTDRIDERAFLRVVYQHCHPRDPLQCQPVPAHEMEAGNEHKRPGEGCLHNEASMASEGGNARGFVSLSLQGGDIPFRIQRGLTPVPSRRDGLSVDMVGDVAGGENAGYVRMG